MKPNKQKTDWKKEFDKTFYSKGGGLLIRKYEDYASEIEVKDFISQLLKTQREEIVSEIEGIVIKNVGQQRVEENGGSLIQGRVWCEGFNQAIKDIIKLLEKKEVSLSGKKVSVTIDNITYSAIIK